MTKTLVFCSAHIFPPDYDDIREYPSTTLSRARSNGWRTTKDFSFSPLGGAVWICPSCVEWLRKDYLRRREHDVEFIDSSHSRRVADLETDYRHRLHDLREFHSTLRDSVERKYNERLASLDY